MSVFSPSTWIPHRTRVHSNNSADFSKDDTLQGLNVTSPLKSLTPPRNAGRPEEGRTPLSSKTAPLPSRSTLDLSLGLQPPPDRIVRTFEGRAPKAYSTTHIKPIPQHLRNASATIPTSSAEDILQTKESRDVVKRDSTFRRIFDSPEKQGVPQGPAMEVQDFSVEVYHQPLDHIAEIKRTGSGSGVSVISCLTNDDSPTYFEQGPQSCSGANGNDTAPQVAQTERPRGVPLPIMSRPSRPKPLHARAATEGRDFGSLFDHLVEPKLDKLDMYLKETKQKQERRTGSGSIQTSTARRRPHNLARPQNLANHSRCQSDTIAYRPKTCPAYPHHGKGHFRSPTNIGSTSAHATLREKLTCTVDDSSLNLLPLKPPIAMSRSTSNTAQSTSGGTASSGTSESEMKQVVAPIDSMSGQINGTTRGGGHYRRNSSGFGHTSGANSFSLPEESVVENGSMFRTTEEEYEPGSFSRILVQNQHGGFLKGRIRFENTEIDGDVSSRVEDKSVASSDSKFTSDSRFSKGRRNILKDEFKFMMGRMIPGPIKKVSQMIGRKPKLTRSEGCLT